MKFAKCWDSADDTALGSRAFTGIARAVWHLSRDSEDKRRRLLLPGKNNLACEGDGLAFMIGGEPVRLWWEDDPVAMSADQGLAAEQAAHKPGPDADAQDTAVAWLNAALADGPRLAKELLDEWKNGQCGSKRTLDRAKQVLGVEAYRDAVPGPWFWRHSLCDSKVAKTLKTNILAILATLQKTREFCPFLMPQIPRLPS